MTELHFHHHVPNRLDYCARLLRKAYRSGAEVAVLGDETLLQNLSKQLWLIGELDFVPHAGVDASEPEKRYSTIAFVSQLNDVTHHHMVLNLRPAVPEGFERFDRLIEIVGIEASEREQARERLGHYKKRGYAIHYYQFDAKT